MPTREALEGVELDALLVAAPPARAVVYLTAATTGLRRAELKELRTCDLDLDADAPTVTARASTTKNRDKAVLPLPPETAAALRGSVDSCTTRDGGRALEQTPQPHRETDVARARAVVHSKSGGGEAPRVFASIPSVADLRTDLAAARANWIRLAPTDEERRERERSDFCRYEDGAGRVVDFHALRSTYATLLGRQGVPLVMAQQLMRHSDPKLTSNVYTRFELHDLHAAVARIDRPLVPPHVPPLLSLPRITLHFPALRATTPHSLSTWKKPAPPAEKPRAEQAPSWCPL